MSKQSDNSLQSEVAPKKPRKKRAPNRPKPEGFVETRGRKVMYGDEKLEVHGLRVTATLFGFIKEHKHFLEVIVRNAKLLANLRALFKLAEKEPK